MRPSEYTRITETQIWMETPAALGEDAAIQQAIVAVSLMEAFELVELVVFNEEPDPT